MVSLEAIACGRPVITYVSSEYPEYKDFPLKDTFNEEEIIHAIREANFKLWRNEHAYLEENHKPEYVAQKLQKIYSSLGGHGHNLGDYIK
jgi:glycosyltransferase involved in cell wall biosynthesis